LGRQRLERDIQNRLIRQAAPRIEDDTLLVLDLSDLTKKHAEKMEYMAWVRDGSEKELGWGYWTLNIVGANTKGSKIVPLHGRLFLHAVPGHRSENEEIREAVGMVAEGVRKRGIWVMDRGLRTAEWIKPAVDLARSCPVLFFETVVKEEAGQERLIRLSCGMRKVRLPDRREELTLVVVKGFGEEPLMILTNLPVRRSRKSLWHVVASCITR
jgi:hypothetical protein